MSVSDVFSTVMKARRVIAIISIVAGAGYKAVPMVWHKAEAKPNPMSAGAEATNGAVAKGPMYSFGELTLTNHYETSVAIGEDKSCRVVPKLVGKKNLELTLALESHAAGGRTQGLSVKQVVAEPGKPFEIKLGGVYLSFTPKLANDKVD